VRQFFLRHRYLQDFARWNDHYYCTQLQYYLADFYLSKKITYFGLNMRLHLLVPHLLWWRCLLCFYQPSVMRYHLQIRTYFQAVLSYKTKAPLKILCENNFDVINFNSLQIKIAQPSYWLTMPAGLPQNNEVMVAIL
jgi:hypothetical protein